MKNTKKLFLFIAIVAVIGFSALSLTGCIVAPEDVSDLSGTITISPSTGDIPLGTELTATYSGSETVIFQWYKWVNNGASTVGTPSTTKPNKFTPTEAGEYNVTVSAEGYKTKISAHVTVTGTLPTDLNLSGTITISPSTGVTTETELTATYSGEETVTYQWKKDGSNVGTASTTKPNKYTPTAAGNYTVTVSAIGYTSKTSDAVTVTDAPSDNWPSGDVWLKTKESQYDITSGVVGDVKSVADTEWFIYKYASNTKYEQKYTLTNQTGEMTTYRKRDGLNEESSVVGLLTISGTDYPMNTKAKNLYDSDTGLMVTKNTLINSDGEEDTPTEYEITLLSDSGGVKTYKRITGDGEYEVYKIQDGRIISREQMLSYGHYTLTYTFPDNEVIRSKLPDFTLEGMRKEEGDSIYNNRYQEVSIVSDDSSALVIRVKRYGDNFGDNNYTLSEQTDIRYEKFSMPLSE